VDGTGTIPLYKPLCNLDLRRCPHPNLGLLFDRYPNVWNIGDEGVERKDYKDDKDQKDYKDFLDLIEKRMAEEASSLAALLQDLHGRRSRLFREINARPLSFVTQWRFVSGLGAPHCLDNGFTWDRNLGVPYIPGSSLKGALRAAAEYWGLEKMDELRDLFGDDTAGAMVVFDAYPTRVPRLDRDVVNVHYREYYESGGRTPPADYLSPEPVTFLTVGPGTEFSFAIAPRPGARVDDSKLSRAETLLKDALETLGIGAKTAVGYGRFLSGHRGGSSDR